MKKKLWIIFAVMFALVLCACGGASKNDNNTSEGFGNTQMEESNGSSDNSKPNEQQIMEDLQLSLTQYRIQEQKCDLVVKEFVVEKSISEEKTYYAELKVTADAEYACYELNAEVEYTLYDQGWGVDSCAWEITSGNVVRYPNDKELSKLKDESGIIRLEDIDIQYDESTIMYTGRETIDWSSFAVIHQSIKIYWGYDWSADWWYEISRHEIDKKCQLTSTLEGNWKLYGEDGEAIITNVSEIGFDMEVHATQFETEKFYIDFCDVEIQENATSMNVMLNSSTFTFNGSNTGSAMVYLQLYENDQHIENFAYDLCCHIIINNYSASGPDAYGATFYHELDPKM